MVGTSQFFFAAAQRSDILTARVCCSHETTGVLSRQLHGFESGCVGDVLFAFVEWYNFEQHVSQPAIYCQKSLGVV